MSEIQKYCLIATLLFAMWLLYKIIRDYEDRDEHRRRAALREMEREERREANADRFEQSKKILQIMRGEMIWLPSLEKIDGTLRYEYAMSYPLPPKRWQEHFKETGKTTLPPEIEGLKLDPKELAEKLTKIWEI